MSVLPRSPAADLQRLATLLEAVRSQKDILKDISAKLDRALMGGRGRERVRRRRLRGAALKSERRAAGRGERL